MNIFESLNQTSDKAIDVGEVYFKKTQEYYKLKIFQQLATYTGIFCKIVIIGSFLFLSLIFLTVAGTLALGDLLGNMIHSCLIVGVILLLISTLLYQFRAKIDSRVVQKISKQFFN